MARVQCRVASANAYSATAVLPADVCAATNTLSPRSRRHAASFWNASSSNGNVIAGSGAAFRNASSTSVKRSITAHRSSSRAGRGFLSGFRPDGASRAFRDRAFPRVSNTRTERNTASTSSSNASNASSSETSSSAFSSASDPDAASASDEPVSDPSAVSAASAASADAEPPVSNALIIRSSCVHGAPPRSSRAATAAREKSAASASTVLFSSLDSAHGEGAKPRGVPANTPASNSASHDAPARLASASRRLADARAAASQPAPPGVNGCCVEAPRTKSAGAPGRRRSARRTVSRHPTVSDASEPRAIATSPVSNRVVSTSPASPPHAASPATRGESGGSVGATSVSGAEGSKMVPPSSKTYASVTLAAAAAAFASATSRRLARARSASAGARSASNDTRGSSG